jgi:hypothetical protein
MLVDVDDLVDCGEQDSFVRRYNRGELILLVPLPPPNFIVESMGISGLILIELLVAGVEFL